MNSTVARASRPFLPDERETRSSGKPRRGRDRVARFVAAALVAKLKRRNVEDVAAKLFPSDPATLHLIRSATSPASTTQSGWAAELAATAVEDFLGSLTPESAVGRLLEAGLQVDLAGRFYSALLPRRNGLPATVPFVGEGGAMPVVTRNLTSASLTPKKLAIISAFSHELADRSDFARIVETILREDTEASLEAAIFSSTPGSAIRPPGLLAGVTPLAGAAGGGFAAFSADMAALVAQVVAAGGGSSLLFVMHPVRWLKMALVTSPPGFPYPSVPTRALATDAVVVMDPGAFASTAGAVPEVDVSFDALLHMDDADPAHIGTVGTPNVIAAPTRSLFQTDSIGTRLILDIGWVMRAPHIAYLTGATW